jgi:hydroxyethylthiazole kinase-like uncharacterized protein yjeF
MGIRERRLPFSSVRICTGQEIRELDDTAKRDFMLKNHVLMENAGQSATQILLEHYPHAGHETEVLIFAGKGNNAGDGFVVARRLLCLGRKVRVFYMDLKSRYSGPALHNLEILEKMKAKTMYVDGIRVLEEFFKSSSGPFTIVDGILGTGLKGNLEGIYYDVVELINSLGSMGVSEIVSLDLPSGVNADNGSIHGTSVIADLTISFGFPKLGHFLPPGAARRGKLVNADISFPPEFRKCGDKFLLTKERMSALIKERDRYGHKSSFGHALLVGGSPGKLGAVAMAAKACHKMGTGLVTVGTWVDSFDPLLIKIPNETMLIPLKSEGEDSYKHQLSNYSSITIGPGLGTRREAKALLEELLARFSGPIVLDADALNVIAEHRMFDQLARRRAPVVLTPHPGEMSRLLGVSKDQVKADPLKAVKDAVNLTNSIVVLKGAATLISSPDEELYLNHYPNDGMATAGSGDVLAGMIGGLLGQGMEPFQATLLGVYLHSLAGDFAAKTFGHRSMTAPDITDNISNAFKEIKTTTQNASTLAGHISLL